MQSKHSGDSIVAVTQPDPQQFHTPDSAEDMACLCTLQTMVACC
jgi:hypothetical protein